MRFPTALALAVIGFSWVAVPTGADAKQPRGGKGAGSSKWATPPGWTSGEKTGWNGGSTPPGWSRGRKAGWGGEQMPPGLFQRR